MPAVITCDIVNSTLLTTQKEQQLLQQLKQILSTHQAEFYRGDSFQIYLPDSAQALQIALRCRTAAIQLNNDGGDIITDVRTSIGIGAAEKPVRALATAKGEAFLLSGRALDELSKKTARLVIKTSDHLADLACSVIGDYINSIFMQMTAKQAEVIYELLAGQTQQQVADKLKRSKSTISQHVTAGRWDEIEELLNKYRKLTELIKL